MKKHKNEFFERIKKSVEKGNKKYEKRKNNK